MTGIQWTDKTWNPIAGCSVVSPGCTNCYAMKMAARLDRIGVPHYAGLTQSSRAGAVWTGKMARAPDHILTAPLRRKKRTMYFVNSMSDLFHESVPLETLLDVFAVMALSGPNCIFQVLTKRAERQREMVTNWLSARNYERRMVKLIFDAGLAVKRRQELMDEWLYWLQAVTPFPVRTPPNVWLGVSVENCCYKSRIDDLRNTEAPVRFLSCEPLLGPLGKVDLTDIHWVIVGGESGARARPMHASWVQSMRDQCADASVPFFFKQWGGITPKSGGRMLDGVEHNGMPKGWWN